MPDQTTPPQDDDQLEDVEQFEVELSELLAQTKNLDRNEIIAALELQIQGLRDEDGSEDEVDETG